MRIRVAYDTSVLGDHFGRPEAQHGILRVTEELLFALAKHDEVALTLIALCGSDPLLSSINSHTYFKANQDHVGTEFAHGFRSRLGLSRLYRAAFNAPTSPTSTSGRVARALLYRMQSMGIDQLRPHLESEQYDVFHSPSLPLPSVSVTKDVPRVLTVYDLIPIRRPEFVAAYHVPFFKSIINSVNIQRDYVTCISEFTRSEFCEYTGMSPERVFVTPLAAGPAFKPVEDQNAVAEVRAHYGIPEGNYLLSLAAPQPRKNLAHLVRAFFRLLHEQPGLAANLVLAGSKEQGWDFDEIFGVAASSPEHRDRVIFTGYVADADLAGLLTGASAFVFPSLYEGFGLPALEAMACGTAVIASNTTSVPEVVAEAGLLVDPHDEDELCEAILRILNDDGLRQEMRRKSLNKAAEFSWDRCAEETVNAYRVAANDVRTRRRTRHPQKEI